MSLSYDPDIFDAIKFRDLKTVQSYWQEAIDIDYQERGGNSMLMMADYYGSKDIVEFLLPKQPSLSLTNDRGQTAADIAREQEFTEILSLLNEGI